MEVDIKILQDEKAITDVMVNMLSSIEYLTSSIEEGEKNKCLYKNGKRLTEEKFKAELAIRKQKLEMLKSFFTEETCKQYIEANHEAE